MEHQIKEFTSPVLDKPLKSHKIACPLHYFGFGGFKKILLKNGYELAHPEGIFFHRPSRDLIYAEAEGFEERYSLTVLTTLDFQQLESLFSLAFLEEYKNKYVLIEGTEAIRVQGSLNGPNFDGIRHTLPQIIVNTLESSLWNFEEYCQRFSANNLSNTLGILLYSPPGVGKTFVLRSYFNKLLLEKGFTIVQIYQGCLDYINMSVLLNSCKALFPCILFLEDIDIKFKDRQECIGTLAGFLLETFEGLSQTEKVVLVATSNNVEVIEKALLRPGRIDYVLEVEKSSKAAKELVLSSYLAGLDINLPLPLKEMLIKGVDTFAELKGAVQHLLRTYVSTGNFPPVEEMGKMIRAWKEARLVGVSEPKEREAGF